MPDSFLITLLEEYWMNSNGNFNFKISALAERYALTTREISSRISSINSYIGFGNCSGCGNENVESVKNRTHANQVIENIYYHHFCLDCRQKATSFCKTMSEEDKKIVWMKLSFKYQLWTKLDKDGMHFLKAIYFLRSWNHIYHELILPNQNYGFKILAKLDKMNLIYYNKDNLTGRIKIKMLTSLQILIREKQI